MKCILLFGTFKKRPNFQKKFDCFRNNLTIIESILLRGEGGIGTLQVGNRKIGSSIIPIILEINENQYTLCLSTLKTIFLFQKKKFWF
jgi:hypothetical protein